MAARIFPVLLSGGSGSRLWPLSRESFPKQLLPLMGERTPLQDAASRLIGRYEPMIVVANAEHRFAVAEQLRDLGVTDATLILEPAARNTAPAIAAAALVAAGRDPRALVLVAPADHHLPEAERFHAAVQAGAAAAEQGRFVLFGITPTRPATGYGYIRGGTPEIGPTLRVDRFVEKPDLATAEALLAEGGHYWNSGVFLLPAAALLDELRALQPQVLAAVERALAGARQDLDFLRLDAEAFAGSPSISIDHAVMEKTARAVVAPADFAWGDMGAWSSLWQMEPRDADGNVLKGPVIARRSRGAYVRSDGPVVATLGVEDLVVVATKDAVLVAAMSADEEVKRLVEAVKARWPEAAAQSRRTYRPWGWYELMDAGERFQVKRIMVRPGGRLSLQTHSHRSEHWVVVNGRALVHLDGAERTLGENESVYIPAGAPHRLSNPGEAPLHVIEVQSGALLSEADIVRLEDDYARG